VKLTEIRVQLLKGKPDTLRARASATMAASRAERERSTQAGYLSQRCVDINYHHCEER